MSEFLRHSALERSLEVIRNNNSIILSPKDRDAFLSALENPKSPNKNLKNALKHYKRLVKDG